LVVTGVDILQLRMARYSYASSIDAIPLHHDTGTIMSYSP